jgi:hypothetical protein
MASTITLDDSNSLSILNQYIELAQQKGAYLLSEAELLKRASDVLMNNVQDNEVNQGNAKQLLVQGVQKGQRHGAYTLSDAALLHKVVTYLASQSQSSQASQSQSQAQAPSPAPIAIEDDDDLADLAEPIPLRPKVV